MKLLTDEKILLEANDGILTLTTHRVRLDQRDSGRSKLVGITLDAVASCGLVTRNVPSLLVIAAGIAAFGLVQFSQVSGGTGEFLLLVAAAFIAAYFLTRSSVLAITSAGEAIAVALKGMSHDAVEEFIETLE